MTKISSYEKQVADLQEKCNTCFIEMVKKDNKISILNSQINELHIKLQSDERAVVLLKKLFGKFDVKLMGYINERGKKRQPTKRPHPTIIVDNSEKDGLLMKAKLYDAENFFVLKRSANGNNLRIHYRIFAKLYRLFRDGMLNFIKAIYRFMKGPK